MSDEASSVRIEDLLAHREWLARLARRLVADPQSADDVVQETWLVALRRPPARIRRVRAWLATVARNLVRERGRSDASRRRREERASRPDGVPDTGALVERAELRRHLAGLVLALPEPFRTTILLRFDEDLSSNEIARRTGTPASTVRGRVRKGLSLLREELDRSSVGKRGSWTTALLPLAGLDMIPKAAGGAVVAGGMVVGTKLKVVLAAAVLLLVAGFLSMPQLRFGDDEEPAPRHPASADLPGSPVQATSEPEIEEGPSPRYACFGRVVGPRRFPRAGATVVLTADGAIRDSTLTDAEGRFRIPLPVNPDGQWLSIEARSKGAPFLRAVPPDRLGSVRNRKRDVDYGDVVLRAGYSLDVLVEHAGRGVPGARVEMIAHGPRRQGHLETVTTGADGRVRIEGIHPTRYLLVAHAEGLASRAVAVGLPRAEDTVLRIALDAPRELEVEVVTEPDQRPVPGVEVYALCAGGYRHRPSLRSAPTDIEGRTRIVGVGRYPGLNLGVAARGYAETGWAPIQREFRPRFKKLVPVPIDGDRVRVVLPEARRVEWPVVEGDAPIPPDGVLLPWHRWRREGLVTFNLWHGVKGSRMERGRLVVEGIKHDRPFAATISTPDGALAHIACDRNATEGPAVSFCRPRRLEVIARFADGTPAPEVSVSVVHREEWKLGPAARTDSAGVAVLEDLVAARGQIVVHPPGTTAGEVDLVPGDARIEVTVPPARPWQRLEYVHPLTIKVTLDGVPGLPAEYRLDGARVEREDPVKGLLYARWGALSGAAGGKVSIASPDHLSAACRVTLETSEVELDLRPAARILYRVLREPGQRVWPRLQRWTGASWGRALGMAATRFPPLEPPLVGDAYLKEGVAPGRYRLHDRVSGCAGEEATVRADGKLVVLSLDARPPAIVEGFVIGPEGVDLRGAFLEMTSANGEVKRVPVDAEGRFRQVLANPGEEVILTARHPLLAPDPEIGHAPVRGAREGLTLALVRTPVVTAHLDVETEAARPPAAPRALLLRDPRDREPMARLPAKVVVDGPGRWRLRFGCSLTGRLTIWCDLGEELAPLVIENVELGAGDRDLGRVRLGPGSRLRVESKDGLSDRCLLRFIVESLDGPPLTRSRMTQSSTLEIPGIGPGRYRVHGGIYDAWGETWVKKATEEIVFDGRSVVERTIETGK